MKTSTCIYRLQPPLGNRQPCRFGALLKITFDDGVVGYADCHPWPEIGDEVLGEQLKKLAEGQTTPLTQCSVKMARIDGEARQAKRHLFADLMIPTSHSIVTDLANLDEDYLDVLLSNEVRFIKIKVGVDPQAETHLLKQLSPKLQSAQCLLRLDFNCRLNRLAFIEYWRQLDDLKECIDFFEDPFPYHPQEWQKLREQFHMPLACDRNSLHALSFEHSCDVLVVKPAVQDLQTFLGKQRGKRSIVVTSYLDHPIGQLGAAYQAAQAAVINPSAISICGLLSHYAYNETPFSRRLAQQYGRLIPSMQGYGWGYDDLLEQQSWLELI